MTAPLYLTTSWDDGHPLDLRVADRLAAHGFAGTFYVPRTNREGRPVMTTGELRALGASFEIGGHSLDHVRLTRLPATERDRQIRDGKSRIEDELGRAITGFCYPGGAHDPAVREAVRAAGFGYARTVANLALDPPRDRYQLGTTLQLFPHGRRTYLKNFARCGQWRVRARPLASCLRDGSLDACLERLLRLAARRGGVFHVWGHSWELEENRLWGALDR
ncbi:MAG TPA: polysaccharide deacetylase family protein, partial [Kofleriaceae bacterium]|nr:polysaccharide deacetylase family protein [Kofleriaceae bacterium]